MTKLRKGALFKTLEDIQVIHGSSLDNKVIHADIIDDDLVIHIDFDNARIAAMQYLQLAGIKMDDKHMKEKIDQIVDELEMVKINV